ncbi:DUF1365 domain-containing protein [Hirschia baltica]|uniref:Cyclopropane-fatty-acyl-phospholipid synthase n=1 Tax=Hirschia baltica (strain ATCC 49814 / DSM 5838 / IFAM 1418) TaxID=582402 RepID=C6XIR9_HIRBI|nr:DUF1365 domain-containing protein [Hirschia baltica]ACT59014.1 protein of unknown function DUF1365 [Hirschia baltica ATCC 49814]
MQVAPNISERSAKLLKANVFHSRNGKVKNAFNYKADYVLFPISKAEPKLPYGLTRNKFGIWAINDVDVANAKSTLYDYSQSLIKTCSIPVKAAAIVELLTMPAFLGYSFNPISFWLFKDSEKNLRAIVVEVTNVGRDRHSYLCKMPDFAPIKSTDKITTDKRLHVSPFQTLDGNYRFHFDVTSDYFSVRIQYETPNEDGLTATLQGEFLALKTRTILSSCLRLPLGALRVMSLILWQAIKLKIKGAKFRRRPSPPTQELSQ